MATALCNALRNQTNDMVRIANHAVAGIEGKSPQERFESIDSRVRRGRAGGHRVR